MGIQEQGWRENRRLHATATARLRGGADSELTLTSPLSALLLPNTTKNKASLLAEVVRHVTELRKRAADVAGQNGDGCCSGGGSESWTFPGETDETEFEPGSDAGNWLGEARVVRAEMATVGGRTKSVVVMQWGGGGEAELGNLEKGIESCGGKSGFGFWVHRGVPTSQAPSFLYFKRFFLTLDQIPVFDLDF
ncbi:hypothetical protein CK203_105443 [Vitis vinifera]|uniref:BHLH domain-containing protein n=1 Tax=Vitis vinifera TaxID=29760 RepID=A0A438F7V0_VITVI|nr:hypothetical protein CK203_105443 [Vitis vinifera]